MADKIKKDLKAVQGLSNQRMLLETINSNFLSVMSMIIGINCRLNVQESLLREILDKINGNKSEEGEKCVQSDEDKDGTGDDNTGDGLNLMDHLVTTLGTQMMPNEGDTTAEIDEKEITCSECKQVFIRGTGEFTRHLRETTCRPYACDVCQKLFKKKSNMKTHRITHSENIWICTDCGASFKCDQYMKNHQKRVHQMAFIKEEEQILVEPEAKRIKTSEPTSLSSPDSSIVPRADFEEFMMQQMGANIFTD